MTIRNVMVFPCGSEIGLEIHRSLRRSTHFKVFGASSADDHGSLVYENYVNGLPFVGDDTFADALNRVVKGHAIDLLVPAHDSVVLALAELAQTGSLACPVVTSPLETCALARSKRATYKRLASVVPTPQIYPSAPAATYPAFVKPDVGQGSKGAARVESAEMAEALLRADPSLLLMEYLPGPEFTVDCFTDRTGSLLYCAGRSRTRVANGISVRSQFHEDPRFRDFATRINAAVEFRGAWFFQVKARDDGELVLLEIAPRVAGTMGLSRARGVNLPLLSLFDALDMPVEITCNDEPLVVDRALHSRYRHAIEYQHVYLDFDDTLLVDGKINTDLIAFVYQCRNHGIPVTLITRHAEDLGAALDRHCLVALFDAVVWLRNGEDKAAHIAPHNAIFIDDSWAERERVRQVHGIPVFDPNMIDVLLKG